MYMTLAVHKGLREQPNATAAICGADRVTRAELAERVARLAGVWWADGDTRTVRRCADPDSTRRSHRGWSWHGGARRVR
jgi:hypothetical protein